MNKKVLVISSVVVITGAMIFVVAGIKTHDTPSTNPATLAAKTEPTTPTFSDIKTALSNGGQLIDVRTVAEYSAGHIAEATNTPVEEIQNGAQPAVSKDTAIYLYCHSGRRAGIAKEALNAAGYTNVTNLGGMKDVISIGGTQIQ